MTKQNIGAILFFGGAITFFAYPQILKSVAKKHPEKDFTKMTLADKTVMGLSVASFLSGGVMLMLLLAVVTFEVVGTVEPKGLATAVLHGATQPFAMTVKSFPGGTPF